MIIEVEQYIAKNYYQLLKIAKKYTKNDDWASELLHEVVLQLYDKKELKLNLDDTSIKAYIIRCLMVNWCYPSSPFFKKHKKHNNTHIELSEIMELVQKDSELEEHRLMDILEQEFGDVNWFNKIIFEKYLTLNSLKRVSLDTKITIPSIGRYVKETKTQVRFNTIRRFENE
jgi:hypothetical protein